MTRIIKQEVYSFVDDDAVIVCDSETDRQAIVEKVEDDSLIITFLNSDGRKSFYICNQFARDLGKTLLEITEN